MSSHDELVRQLEEDRERTVREVEKIDKLNTQRLTLVFRVSWA